MDHRKPSKRIKEAMHKKFPVKGACHQCGKELYFSVLDSEEHLCSGCIKTNAQMPMLAKLKKEKIMSNYYILDENGNPKPEENILKWARSFENGPSRHIGWISIFGIKISTVFLGIDHSFSTRKGNKPVLWETMVFGGEYDGYQERYTTKEEALKGHRRAVWLVVKNLPRELLLVIKSKISDKDSE